MNDLPARVCERGESTTVFLELFDAFEADDADVLARTRSSVEYCRGIIAAIGKR
jgi:hypothetical protein